MFRIQEHSVVVFGIRIFGDLGDTHIMFLLSHLWVQHVIQVELGIIVLLSVEGAVYVGSPLRLRLSVRNTLEYCDWFQDSCVAPIFGGSCCIVCLMD